jgi:hypothetical protein
VGLAWSDHRWQASTLLTYHSGWPRTGAQAASASNPTNAVLLLGPRNAARWGAYYSLDMHAAWTKPLHASDLQFSLDLTNVTNHGNECCLGFEADSPTVSPAVRTDVDLWLPRTANVGVTWRFH